MTRRQFLAAAAASPLAAQVPGDRPTRSSGVVVENPRNRVPVSIIIDDSTCLVNLNKFAMPQFSAATGRVVYDRDWRSWPDEIPDSFVQRFAEWAEDNGVKGKYSIVPFPACVGRLDLGLPGWSRADLEASIRLVREDVTRNWDIHPEMVTHTRVINTKTGHPYPELSPRYMENWDWSDDRSVDELADYMRYALNILNNIGMPCEGVTTPGGFGTGALPQLSQATLEACRDVYAAEIPHYFRHLYSDGEESVAPRVEYASGLDGDDPQCVVSIIGCTGDWTGGWDNVEPVGADRFISSDLSQGRMVDVVERGEPACMVCHWTGIYWNGRELGLNVFREVVDRLHAKYDNLIWMKLSEISRYWAAKELTRIESSAQGLRLRAPFECPGFTVSWNHQGPGPARMREASDPLRMTSGSWHRSGDRLTVCFDLPRGESTIDV